MADGNGKVAIATRAARGIGRASCVALAAAGFDVAGIDVATRVADIPDLVSASKVDLAETGRIIDAPGRR